MTMPSGIYLRRRNDRVKAKSGYRGVYFCRHLKNKPWKSYIRHYGMYIGLGYFKTKEEAAKAYNREARRLHKDRAYLNPV